MSTRRICLVTIHGVGFEQPPIYKPGALYPDVTGYADDLHERLSKYLNKDKTLLSDDPGRKRQADGQNGAIYVQSIWPTDTPEGTPSLECGRSRLGTWRQGPTPAIKPLAVNGEPASLYDTAGTIAHVALVYSQEEGINPLPGTGINAVVTALTSLGQYAHIARLAQNLLADIEQFHKDKPQTVTPSLRVRQDAGAPKLSQPKTSSTTPDNAHPPDGSISILKVFENDVAAYVCHNELRERIRSFVFDALLRLACRDDVDGIVINAHSNGTVIAFDTLSQLPSFAARKILGIVTAGSPLRKYTKLFNWGRQMAILPPVIQWINFFDPRDLVADPLYTPLDWLIGDADPIDEHRAQSADPVTGTLNTESHATKEFLYRSLDPNTGIATNIPIQDRPVDNLRYSLPGGLPAHNYWDNEVQFIPVLGALLEKLVQDE